MKLTSAFLLAGLLFAMVPLNRSLAQNAGTTNAADPADTVLWNYIGLYGGFNLNTHSADFRALPGVPNCCPQFADGSGTGLAFGLLYEFPFTRQWWFEMRAGYSQRDAQLSREENIGNAEELSGNTSVPAFSDHTLDATLNYIGLEPTAEYRGFGPVSVNAGIVLGFWMTAEYDQIETLTRPSDVTFLDGSRERNASAGEIPESESMYMGAVLGAGYDLPVGERMFLTPELRLHLPLNDVASVAWQAQAIQLGASFKMQLGSLEKDIVLDTIYIRDTVETIVAGLKTRKLEMVDSNDETTTEEFDDYILERTTITENYRLDIPRPFVLESSLAVYGIDANGRRTENPKVVIEETEIFETLPLLPHVFFEQGSADLGGARINKLDKSEASDFSINKIPASALEVYSNSLNVVGLRLRESPGSTITLLGHNNNIGDEKGNTQLSQQRAEAVKSYLVNVWGIDAGRISTQSRNLPEKPSNNTTEDGQAENRRVEIVSSDADLLQPVSIEEVEVEAIPAELEVVGTTYAEGGLDNYTIDVMQGRTRLRSFDGGDTSAVHRWEVLDEPRPADEKQNLTVRYTSNDDSGQQVVKTVDVPLEQLTLTVKRAELKDDKRIEIFSLILFDFGKATLDSRNRRIMDRVRAAIEPNSTVKIYGYADRQGEADYNRELARKRSAEARAALGNAVSEDRVEVIAVGSDQLIYDNDLPEGRSYSRTVRIVIETPVSE